MVSVIMLNMNEVNNLIKRQRLSGWIFKTIHGLQEIHLNIRKMSESKTNTNQKKNK